jgi:hypothetical protein
MQLLLDAQSDEVDASRDQASDLNQIGNKLTKEVSNLQIRLVFVKRLASEFLCLSPKGGQVERDAVFSGRI